MGSITSGVGLMSGIDYGTLVDQLMSIEAQPRDRLLERVGLINAQKTAFAEISARISAMLSRISSLKNSTFFQGTTSTSSAPDVLSVSTNDGVAPGSYTFRVNSLASSHQLVSRGFNSLHTPIPAGQLTIESASARANFTTSLDELNGYAGVRAGSFTLTDAAGNQATISTSGARSLDDIIDSINAADVDITAAIEGDHLLLTEDTGGQIRIREVDGGQTAADLGFGETTFGTGQLAGTELTYLTENSPLKALSGGLGLGRSRGGSDFTIRAGGEGGADTIEVAVDMSVFVKSSTRLERLNHGTGVDLGTIRISTRDGFSTEIDLSGARTIGDVKTLIEDATRESETGDNRITFVMSDNHINIIDASEPLDEDDPSRYEFSIEDVGDTHAARDLGIAGTADSDKLTGDGILHMDTLGDALAAINFAESNFAADSDVPYFQAQLSDDGRHIELIDGTDGTHATFDLIAGEYSHALADLGLQEGTYTHGETVTGRRVAGGINTVLLSSLNGGQGFVGGIFQIEANGQIATIDATQAQTLRDVIELINAQADTLGIDVGYDSTGLRVEFSNMLDDSPITISDVGDDSFATAMGIAQTGDTIQSVNLQRRYISEGTLLSELNAGQGVGQGKIKITSGTGFASTVSLYSSSITTIQDVLTEINKATPDSIQARINDTGDGIVIIDSSGGELPLIIEDEDGLVARNLNIAGESDDGQIDGSLEFNLELSGHETLEEIAAEINDNASSATASVFNDGTSIAPYRLSIKSTVTGAAGELIVDAGQTGLGFSALTQARDASILLGDGADGGLLLTSSTNTFSNVVDGMTLNVSNVSDEPVTVTVGTDIERVVTAVGGFVSDFNAATKRVGELMEFDTETEQAAILHGDGTARSIDNRLYDMIQSTATGSAGSISRLSDLGITLGNGGTLEFDETAFREAYEADPLGVERFFSDSEIGRAADLEEAIKAITDTDGLIDRRDEALDDQAESLTNRADALTELLDRKRERLTNQFIAMEQALAAMQSQQTALSQLASIAASFTTRTSSTSS